MARRPFAIGNLDVAPGTRARVELPVARLPTGTWLPLPVGVLHGARRGPVVWIDAAIHGDEISGVDIIRQVLAAVDEKRLAGTLLAVPIVNVFGFIQQTRYLPDRRDLNRCFPGSPTGSLAARLAHLFMEQVVRRSDFGIDLHSAAAGRSNFPQVRANLEDAETFRLAHAFGAPAIVHSRLRDGSLREAATRAGIPLLVYEAGEPLRFESRVVMVGVRGVLRILAALGMGRFGRRVKPPVPFVATKSRWVRARRGGICRLRVGLGDRVVRAQELAVIGDTFGDGARGIASPVDGLVIGATLSPLVHRGDALLHVAEGDGAVRAPGTTDG